MLTLHIIPGKHYCSPLGSSKLGFIGWRHDHVDNCFSEVQKLNFFRGQKRKVYFCVNYLYLDTSMITSR